MIDFIKSIKGIKSLLFVFTFIASILFFSTVVSANEQNKNEVFWKVGDALNTIMVCREEEDILEIGYADYNGRYTTMVGVCPIGEPENIVGYLIVLGRPLTI